MDHVRNLFVKIKHRWNIVRRSLQSCIKYDYGRCLDLIMICGGIQPLAGPEPWKRNCLILYRLLGFYQFIVTFAKVVLGIVDQDLVGICFSLMVLISFVKGCANVYVLENFDEAVLELKTFLRSNTIHSGDANFDANVRRDAAKIAEKAAMAMILFACCIQMLILIPSTTQDRLLGVPEQFQSLGILAARVLQAAYLWTMVIFWASRYYCSSILVHPLLMGLRSELKIVALAYDTIEDRVQAQGSEDQNKVVDASQQLPTTNALKWKHLKQILGFTLEQHVEVLRNIQLVQPIVSFAYAITHYGTMAMVSTLVFLVIRSGFSSMMVAMAFASCACTVECYQRKGTSHPNV